MDYNKRVCNKCGCEVVAETDTTLKKEYPWHCPNCDENLYGIETKRDIPDMPTAVAEKHNVVAACCCYWCDFGRIVSRTNGEKVRICTKHGNVKTFDFDTCDDCQTGGADAKREGAA